METGKEINLVKYVRTADIVADSLHMIETAQRQAYKVVNVILLRRNWLLGKRIAEEVMDGQERADYGAEVIQKLSKALQAHYGKGYTKTTLYRFLSFYRDFPQIFPTLLGKSNMILSSICKKKCSICRKSNEMKQKYFRNKAGYEEAVRGLEAEIYKAG